LDVFVPDVIKVNSSTVSVLLNNVGTKKQDLLVAVSGSDYVSINSNALSISGEEEN